MFIRMHEGRKKKAGNQDGREIVRGVCLVLKVSEDDPAVWIIELRRLMGFTNRVVKEIA